MLSLLIFYTDYYLSKVSIESHLVQNGNGNLNELHWIRLGYLSNR